MRVVSGHDVPELGRAELADMIVASPGANLCIFTGSEIIVHRGEPHPGSFSILPKGVAKNVNRVHNTPIFEQMLEAIMVEFNNGETATLLMSIMLEDPLDEEDLKEFRARCLMIHDL